MNIFKRYIFFVSAIFLLGLLFPVYNASAAPNSCACYAGEFELSKFSASQASVCADRCSTLPSLTAYSFGDDTAAKTGLAANDGKSGSECWCSADTMSNWKNTADAAGALVHLSAGLAAQIVGAFATAVDGGTFFWMANYYNATTIQNYLNSTQHVSFKVGKFTSRDTCEQMCANKDGKSFVFGNGWLLGNVAYPKIVANTPSAVTTMDRNIAGSTVASGIIQCGRPGHELCTLCDLIKGIYDIVQYIIKIAVWVTLTAIAIGGGMYALSAGNSNMIELAKGAMKKALIGLVIVLTAWLMVNTLLLVIGTQSNLGITGVVSWGKFECAATN